MGSGVQIPPVASSHKDTEGNVYIVIITIMITMNIDVINPYVIKIIIAAREGDSMRSISQRIQLSYGWTYKWMQELAEVGVFRLTKTKIYINKRNRFYQKCITFIRDVLGKDISFYYAVLNLFGIEYCFTKTDAVFMWTKGGYNIARYKKFYPVFIRVKQEDRKIFESYCKKLSLHIKKKGGIFYEVDYRHRIAITYIDNTPADSLHETIHFMEQNKYNFEPALEMIKEMYKKRINVKYKETITNV